MSTRREENNNNMWRGRNYRRVSIHAGKEVEREKESGPGRNGKEEKEVQNMICEQALQAAASKRP